MAFYDEDGNRVTTTFTNAPDGSSKIETRTTVVKDVPTDSRDYLYSPDVTDAQARSNLFQDDHLSASHTLDNPQNSEFFQKISSGSVSELFRYDRRDWTKNGATAPKRAEDAIRLGVSAHNGRHDAVDRFVQDRIHEIVGRGDKVEDLNYGDRITVTVHLI